MKDTDLCKSILGIKAPWDVQKIKVDQSAKRVDIWIGLTNKAGLLSRAGKLINQQDESTWRHLNMLNHHVYIHCDDQEIEQASAKNLAWLGQPGLNLTRAMAKRVVRLLSEGTSYSAVCMILELQLGDIWPIKRALDEGRLLLGGKKVTVKNKKPEAGGDAATDGQEDTNIPQIEDQVWEKIAAGELDSHIRPLALKLLITKVRNQLNNIHEQESRIVKLNEVRRYFVKHQRTLESEIDQLKAIA